MNLKYVAGYAFICLLWGSTWLAIKLGLDSLTPFMSAGLRFTLASILIFGIMKVKSVKLVSDPVAVKLYIYMGFLSFLVPFGLVYWAEQFIDSGIASVIFAIFPFSVLIMSYFFLNVDDISVIKILGMVLGFLGIGVIFSDSFAQGFNLTDQFWGMAAVALSAVLQSVVLVLIKKHGSHLNPLSMNVIPMAIAGVGLTLGSFLFEDVSKNNFDLAGIASIGYLAVFGSIFTFTIYYYLLKRVSAVFMSLVAFITPIVALVLGWWLNGEALTGQHLAGSVLVLIGLLLANLTFNKNQKVKVK